MSCSGTGLGTGESFFVALSVYQGRLEKMFFEGRFVKTKHVETGYHSRRGEFVAIQSPLIVVVWWDDGKVDFLKEQGVVYLQCSTDGTLLAGVTLKGVLVLWDLADCTELWRATVPPPKKKFAGIRFGKGTISVLSTLAGKSFPSDIFDVRSGRKV